MPVLNSGHPIQVTVTYANNVLHTDYYEAYNKSSVWVTTSGINIPALLGSNFGLVGFGGGTGGAASTQTVSNFKFVSTSQITYQPVTLTTSSFTQDMVIEKTAPASGALANITATMDAGTAKTGATWYEQGYNQTNASSALTGLPASGSTFASQADSRHVYTMQSYTANNALLLTTANNSSATAGVMTFATPEAATSLSFLASVGNGLSPFGLTINYADGAPSTTVPYDSVVADWFFQGPAAWDANGRAYANASSATTYDNVNNGQPNLYSIDVMLPDTTDPISSVSLTFDGSAGNLAIFAVSASVPEPASIGLLAAGAAATLVRRRARRA